LSHTDERWVECWDPNLQKFYYIESRSGDQRYDKPVAYVMAADDKLVAAVIRIQTVFRGRKARRKFKLNYQAAKMGSAGSAEHREKLKNHMKKQAEDLSKRTQVWIEVYDPTRQRFYYFDRDTEETTWTKPESYILAADDELMSAVIKIQSLFRMRMAKRRFKNTLIKGRNAHIDKNFDNKVKEALEMDRLKIETTTERWVEVFDPAAQRFYYWESNTGATTWIKPETYIMAADDELMAAVIKIQTRYRGRLARRKFKSRVVTGKAGVEIKAKVADIRDREALMREAVNDRWVAYLSEEHQKYYYVERTTGEITWEKPLSYIMDASDEEIIAAIKIQKVYRGRMARRRFRQNLIKGRINRDTKLASKLGKTLVTHKHVYICIWTNRGPPFLTLTLYYT
jgi:hypothetical protein